MNILLINLILTTSYNGVITPRPTIDDTMIANFAMGFIKNGHRVTIAAAEEFRPTRQQDYPFEVVYFPSRLPKLLRPDLLPWPRNLRRFLKNEAHKFDMIVSSELFSIATLIAAGVCPDKLVVWHELAVRQRAFFGLPAWLWYRVVTPLWLRKAWIIPRSEAAARFISRYSNNVCPEYIDHGANGDVLVPQQQADNTFIVVSRIEQRKRIDKIIAVFARFVALPQRADYTLKIVGDGRLTDALRQQVHQLGIDKNVQFLGFLSHERMAPHLARARAMLIYTEQDNSMVSIPEAIVSGTPVVTDSVPLNGATIRQYGLGIVNDNWNEHDLEHIADHYAEYHQRCIDYRPNLTREGYAEKMVTLFLQHRNTDQQQA